MRFFKQNFSTVKNGSFVYRLKTVEKRYEKASKSNQGLKGATTATTTAAVSMPSISTAKTVAIVEATPVVAATSVAIVVATSLKMVAAM